MLLQPNLLCIWGSSCTAPPQLVNHCKWLIFQDLLGIRKDKIRKIKALICTIVAGGFPCFSDKDRVPRHCNAFTYQFLQHNFVYLAIFIHAKNVVFFLFFLSAKDGLGSFFSIQQLSNCLISLQQEVPLHSPSSPLQEQAAPSSGGKWILHVLF